MKKRILLFLVVCIGICGCASQESGVPLEQWTTASEKEVRTEDGTEAASENLSGQREAETDPAFIYVDIAGAVNRPGVVKVPYGARVYEALEKAGGMRTDAASASVNQAERLEDGQQIRIYTQEEMNKLESSPNRDCNGKEETESPKINLNKATAEELMTLPGIGESRALDIIRYREENGGFGTIEDIMQVSGIKEAVFDKIKDKIEVTQ